MSDCVRVHTSPSAPSTVSGTGWGMESGRFCRGLVPGGVCRLVIVIIGLPFSILPYPFPVRRKTASRGSHHTDHRSRRETPSHLLRPAPGGTLEGHDSSAVCDTTLPCAAPVRCSEHATRCAAVNNCLPGAPWNTRNSIKATNPCSSHLPASLTSFSRCAPPDLSAPAPVPVHSDSTYAHQFRQGFAHGYCSCALGVATLNRAVNR